MSHSILVVGAGAAGLMAAIHARLEGNAVTLIEKTVDGGRKILISGGGRCNVLPAALQPERFVSDSPAHLVRHFLRSWPLSGQRAFFETIVGIPLALEAETAKLFPASNRARDVRDGLVGLAHRHGVEFQFGTSLTGLIRRDGTWLAETSRGEITADRVVLATGGLSVPATGSDGIGLRVARELGHRINETYPALTPLTADPPVHAVLAGVSVTPRLRAKRSHASARAVESRGGFLFTHKGYSGPSVLDISHVAVRSRANDGINRAAIRVQWCPLDARSWEETLLAGTGLVVTTLARHLPQRLAERLLIETAIPLDRRAAELRRVERVALIESLTAYLLPWSGDEGYQKAEVTGGGVALDAVDPRTLESRTQPGLFLCGEMLDAFGPIGGHNFAWAWATGRAAGMGAAH